MLLVGASLLAKHVVALPISMTGAQLGGALRVFRGHGMGNRWLAVHVLYSECRCSQRVVAHLLSSPRPHGWDEEILWIGPVAPEPELMSRYRVTRMSSVDLARLGIDSAPLLVVMNPNDEVRYAGGYTDRKQGPAFEDLRIFAAAQRNEPLVSIPVFGCAVSQRLQRKFSVLSGF